MAHLSIHETTSAGEIPAIEGQRHEVLGIITATLTVLFTLSLWSYDAGGGDNLIGPVGTGIAATLASAFGVAAWLIPIETGLATLRLFGRRSALLGVATIASTLVIVLIGCALVHLLLGEQTVFGGHLPGGVIGEVLGEVLRSLLGKAGAYVVCFSTLLITAVLRTPMSVSEIIEGAESFLGEAASRARGGVEAVTDAWKEAKELERAEADERRRDDEPRIVGEDASGDDDANGDDDTEAEEAEDRAPEPPPAKRAKKKSAAKKAAAETSDEVDADESESAAEVKSAAKRKAADAKSGPTIVAPKPTRQEPTSLVIDASPVKRGHRPFVMPSLDLLGEAGDERIPVDVEVLRENAKKLTEKLEAYGVKGRVDEIHPGPVVTMYEFEPRSGTKISKIANLSDDLAMALAASKVRIVAPIPGKARVGFELPNDIRQTVYLREVLEDERWMKHKGNLPIALGKDIGGQPVYADLSKMPHLLVAGATGSGKSVGLNVMLASLLYKKTPEEVRMLMIDPKVVELAVFDGIPHMLLPVVTDMQKASLALKWAVDEMERRYQLFADCGARNISTYNQRVEKVHSGDLSMEKFAPRKKGKVKAQGAHGEEVLLDPVDGERPDACDELPDKLPFIVVVVDEFADLMMVAAKDVEACIARLAQKARAAGIHVILATQRPSVDVITGMIKANFPSRMAFKVSQREDSKTILGRMGAQNLLGMGDMLLLPPGSSDLTRVHSAYVSEDEVKDICDHLREQGQPIYNEDILKPREDGDGVPGQSSDDPQYDKAVAVVANAGYCSISHIQRQLSVGYNKAAKLVERMENEGVVGPPSGKAGGRREVLIQAI